MKIILYAVYAIIVLAWYKKVNQRQISPLLIRPRQIIPKIEIP